jgi:hypothetical protein
MSQTGCTCNGAPLNSGTSGCIEQIKTWDYAVRVDRVDSTGTKNSIPKGTVIDETFVKAKLNNIDTSVRWTVFPKLWAVEDLRDDPLTETIDNIDFIGAQGARKFVGFHIDKFGAPQMAAAWNSADCRDNALFGLTSGGQIEGINEDIAVGDLTPIAIESGTLNAKYIKPTKAPTKQKVQVNFTVADTVDDGCLDFIASSGIAYGTVNWYSDSPIDVIGSEVSNTSQTTIVINMTERFGSVDKNKITGLVIADFSWDDGTTTSAVYNVSNSASLALTTVVETVGTPGEYTLTFAAQTLSDIIQIDISKDGLDMQTALLVTLL